MTGAPFSGQIALVTRAGGGIGAELSRGLARDGATVALHYASNESLPTRPPRAAGMRQRGHGRGMTVIAIAPALIEETTMLPGDLGDLAKVVPAGRLGKLAEVADLALALLRNGYLTSKVVTPDGGIHRAEEPRTRPTMPGDGDLLAGRGTFEVVAGVVAELVRSNLDR